MTFLNPLALTQLTVLNKTRTKSSLYPLWILRKTTQAIKESYFLKLQKTTVLKLTLALNTKIGQL